MKVKNYVKAESLQQAYELNQKRSTRILGGMLWMRQGNGTIQTAVDLSGLGLDQIEETEEEFRIGCMVTLRRLEQHSGLNDYAAGAVRDAVQGIVGVQFRNLATVGGSIWGRFGFSDVLTVFLALDTWVELYQGGMVSLREFAGRKKDNDILVRLIVKKRPQAVVYQAFRNTRTDFPVLTCAVGVWDGAGRAVIGARPGRAICLELPEAVCRKLYQERAEITGRSESCQEQPEISCGAADDQRKTEGFPEKLAGELAGQVPVGSNLRGSGEYRSHLAKVLLKRSLERLIAGEGQGKEGAAQ